MTSFRHGPLTPGNCCMYPVELATQKEYGDGSIGTLL